jgi:hypothetical protein
MRPIVIQNTDGTIVRDGLPPPGTGNLLTQDERRAAGEKLFEFARELAMLPPMDVVQSIKSVSRGYWGRLWLAITGRL